MGARKVIVHSLDHAEAALAAAAEMDMSLVLLSPPGAAQYLGAAVFREMISQAAEKYPGAAYSAVLDCGRDPGLALNALRHGITCVRVDAPRDVLAKIADMAAQLGAAVDEPNERGGGALDLGEAGDVTAALRAWMREPDDAENEG